MNAKITSIYVSNGTHGQFELSSNIMHQLPGKMERFTEIYFFAMFYIAPSLVLYVEFIIPSAMFRLQSGCSL